MIYQIRKNSDRNYTLQLGGTERQIERLADYFNVKLSMPGSRYMFLNITTRKEASADCRRDVMLKKLTEMIEEIIDLASTTRATPVVPRLIENKSWQGGDYQRKV